MRILIGTPTYDGKLDARYTASLVATIRHRPLVEAQIFLEPVFLVGSANLCACRDEILQRGLDAGADMVVFIDADTYWRPETFLTLVSTGRDFVGACQRRKQEAIELTAKPVRGGEVVGPLIEAAWVGFGMVAMSIKCVATLHDIAPSYAYQGKRLRQVFKWPIDAEGLMYGEDVGVCMKWRELGGKVWLHTECPVGHVSYSTTYEV